VIYLKLFEFEGKEIYRKYNIPTPEGIFINNISEVDNLTIEKPVIIKAQILQGGRGKAGGIKKNSDKQSAIKVAKDMFNKSLKDELVSKLLIEELIPYKQEIYLGITIDDIKGIPVIVACAEGGMEIEELAKSYPDKVKRNEINPLHGLRKHESISFMKQIGLQGKLLIQASDICLKLYKMFNDYDGIVAEINPLVRWHKRI
jgi:succinyl-CoA synthetase beta subunit